MESIQLHNPIFKKSNEKGLKSSGSSTYTTLPQSTRRTATLLVNKVEPFSSYPDSFLIIMFLHILYLDKLETVSVQVSHNFVNQQ